MAKSNTDSPDQTKKIHSSKIDRKEKLTKFSVNLAGEKFPDQFHPTRTVQIPDVVRVHLKSYFALREGKRILVPHLLMDQEPLGAENVKILAISMLIPRN